MLLLCRALFRLVNPFERGFSFLYECFCFRRESRIVSAGAIQFAHSIQGRKAVRNLDRAPARVQNLVLVMWTPWAEIAWLFDARV